MFTAGQTGAVKYFPDKARGNSNVNEQKAKSVIVMHQLIPYALSETSFWCNNSCRFIFIFYFFSKSFYSLLNFWRVFRVKKGTADVEIPISLIPIVGSGDDDLWMSIVRRRVCILVRCKTLDKSLCRANLSTQSQESQSWRIHSQYLTVYGGWIDHIQNWRHSFTWRL